MHLSAVLRNSVKKSWIKPDGYDTGIKIYNCIAKEKVPLILRNKKFTTWYTCGPTVYDSAHIGHAACYVKIDIIQRILKSYFNVNLVTVMNITDVDDKIIQKSTKTNKSPMEITRFYEKEFWEDMQTLKIVKPNIVVRVTENISLISNYIQKLVDLKKAYIAEDKSVYFDLSSYDAYGKLQNYSSTTENITNLKKNAADFVLWKASKPGEPFWETQFGPGRPGWHIECSTLASAILGSTIDFHAGGLDLRFPHHENEEAQSCSYHQNSQWVNYWIHTGQLLLKESKMSKSLNNTISIHDFMDIIDTDTFRLACLLSNYNNNINFSKEYFLGATTILKSYKIFIGTCNSFIKGQIKADINGNIILEKLAESVATVDKSLKDDFDTATVIKTLNSLINVTNKMMHSSAESSSTPLNAIAPIIAVVNFVVNTLDLFGIELNRINKDTECNNLDQILDILINFRQDVRIIGLSSKDENMLKLCDTVRNDLKLHNILINDHGKLSTWSK